MIAKLLAWLKRLSYLNIEMLFLLCLTITTFLYQMTYWNPNFLKVTEGIGSLFWILLCWNQGLTDSFFGPVVACLCLTAWIHWCSGACKASEQKLLSKKVNPSLSWQYRRLFKWMVAESSSYSQFTAPVSTLKDRAAVRLFLPPQV